MVIGPWNIAVFYLALRPRLVPFTNAHTDTLRHGQASIYLSLQIECVFFWIKIHLYINYNPDGCYENGKQVLHCIIQLNTEESLSDHRLEEVRLQV